MTTLKRIALELLQKYEETEMSVIWECSGAIEESEKYLDAEVAKYRELIDKYAEQEPCEDSVSIDVIIEWLKSKDIIKMSNQEKNARKELQALFSVQTEPKTGHWIDHENGHWNYAKCSECKTIHDTRSNYCPFCGARMDGYFAGITKLMGE